MAKRSTAKDKAAKDKVQNLLKGTILGKEEEPEVDVLEKAAEVNDVSFLTEEMGRLQSENDQLKSDLDRAFNDIRTLRAGGAVGDDEVKNGVRKIFKGLEDAHFGRNPEKKTYHEAIIKVLLGKFLKEFPFLMKK